MNTDPFPSLHILISLLQQPWEMHTDLFPSLHILISLESPLKIPVSLMVLNTIYILITRNSSLELFLELPISTYNCIPAMPTWMQKNFPINKFHPQSSPVQLQATSSWLFKQKTLELSRIFHSHIQSVIKFCCLYIQKLSGTWPILTVSGALCLDDCFYPCPTQSILKCGQRKLFKVSQL